MNFLKILFISLAAFPVWAAAPCDGNLEAEFIAEYNHVDLSYAEAGNAEHTNFGLKNFKLYQENQTCPLPQEMAAEALITDYRIILNAKTGAEVSGILIYNPKFKMFSIEY